MSIPGQVLISEETYKFVSDMVMTSDPVELKLKGKKKPIIGYYVEGLTDEYLEFLNMNVDDEEPEVEHDILENKMIDKDDNDEEEDKIIIIKNKKTESNEENISLDEIISDENKETKIDKIPILEKNENAMLHEHNEGVKELSSRSRTCNRTLFKLK